MKALAALALSAVLALQPVVASAQLPALGDAGEMAPSAERRLGDRIARELYRDPDYLDDPLLMEYVQGIWQPLLAAARARGDLSPELDERFAWTVLLGRDRSINAFALPGGYFGLHLGLIGASASRDELASVLAHELSHVTQRHISRLISQQNRQTPWLIGAMILGALAASKNPEAANAVVAGGQAVAAQAQLNFSRDMEREADRVGHGVMAQAGFDPQGFVTLFDKLQQAQRHNDSGAFPYLRTHPLNTERIADMQSRLSLAPRGAPPAPDLVHAMMAARARVLSGTGADAWRTRIGEAAAPGLDTQPLPRRAGALYGAALASLKLRDFSAAEAHARRLQAVLGAAGGTTLAASRLARLLDAEIALAADAPQRVQSALDASTAARPELFMWAQAALRNGAAGAAAQRLQTWVVSNPRDAVAWQLLSRAHAQNNEALRAIRADAEAQVALLDYPAAVDRFHAAQELGRRLAREGARVDHIEASIIDTRARQVESLAREQALER